MMKLGINKLKIIPKSEDEGAKLILNGKELIMVQNFELLKEDARYFTLKLEIPVELE